MRLLACISHYHSPERLQYLLRMLEAFVEYELTVDIIIDANVEGLEVTGENLTTVHHVSLEHPFHLCWCHRRHIRDRLEAYDWFMYIEDDIFLPFANFQRYMTNFQTLWPNFVPSFIRVEEFSGEEYVLDVTERQSFAPVIPSFCTLNSPYHGFWIMPRRALKQTMTPDFVRLSDSRETAASFPMWELNKTPVVEIDGKQVARTSMAYHLTNSYAPCPTSPFGKIKLSEIFL